MSPTIHVLRFPVMNTFTLLVIIALIFTVLSIAFPRFPLLAVGVLLLCVALLIGRSLT